MVVLSTALHTAIPDLALLFVSGVTQYVLGVCGWRLVSACAQLVNRNGVTGCLGADITKDTGSSTCAPCPL
jgi:hypothetical protein